MTAIDYQRRANAHRPSDPTLLREEAMKLHRLGLLPRDIGQALELNPEQVRQFMQEPR